MNFIPDYLTLFAFCTASVVLAITPGPDMTLMISRALSNGKRAGFLVITGVTFGIIIHTFFVAFGLSALVIASPTAFWVLKTTGAGYLLWLAIQAVRGSSALLIEQTNVTGNRRIQLFLNGLWVNLLNPKIILFFMTFLPQFVRVDDPDFTTRLLFLGLLFTLVVTPVNVGVVVTANTLAFWLRSKPKVMRYVNYLFACVFSMFAIRIFLTENQ